MTDVRWSDSLCVGVDGIDRHNKSLIELMVQAQESLTENPAPPAAYILLDDLINFFFYHFAAEEIWMEMGRYPKSLPHIQDHLRYTGLIVKKNRGCHAGMITCIDMLSLMFDEFITHIAEFDTKSANTKIEGWG